MAPLKYSIVGEQARYSALLPGPVVIVFRNCAGLFTSSTLLPENILLPLLSRLRFCRGYFFGDASANFPRAINSSRVDAFAVSVGTSRAKFLPRFFLCFWKRVFLPFVPDLLLPPRSERYCSTWNTKCKMGTFLFFYCSHRDCHFSGKSGKIKKFISLPREIGENQEIFTSHWNYVIFLHLKLAFLLEKKWNFHFVVLLFYYFTLCQVYHLILF